MLLFKSMQQVKSDTLANNTHLSQAEDLDGKPEIQ